MIGNINLIYFLLTYKLINKLTKIKTASNRANRVNGELVINSNKTDNFSKIDKFTHITLFPFYAAVFEIKLPI